MAKKAQKRPRRRCPAILWEVDVTAAEGGGSMDFVDLAMEATAEEHGDAPRVIDVNGYDKASEELVASGSLEPFTLETGEVVLQVVWSHVNTQERCGLGTRLYEKMLRVACKQGFRLGSDTTRSKQSEGFWKKQVSRGRAACVDKRVAGTLYDHEATLRRGMTIATPGHWPCRMYALDEACPVSSSLKGEDE